MKFIEWITKPITVTAGEVVYIMGVLLVGMSFNYNWLMLPLFVGVAFYGKYMHEEEIVAFKKEAVKKYKRKKFVSG